MSTSGTTWRLGRRPALDGLRGVAVLLVVACHVAVPGFARGGQTGVTVFFVLSGFLITALLLEEQAAAGRIRLGRFYLRRTLRLAPALVVMVTTVTTFALLVGVSTHGAVPALTYVMDFVQASGQTYHEGLFGHTWSLAIEEQFYLVWPLAVIACQHRRRLVALAFGGAAASLVWRVILESHGASSARLAYGPDTRADALLIGCSVAAWLHFYGAPKVPGWATATARLLEVAWLRLVGKRSYAIYLWHYPLMLFVLRADPTMAWWWRAAIVLPITAGIAALSWRFVERPALQLGSGGLVLPVDRQKVASPPRERRSRAKSVR